MEFWNALFKILKSYVDLLPNIYREVGYLVDFAIVFIVSFGVFRIVFSKFWHKRLSKVVILLSCFAASLGLCYVARVIHFSLRDLGSVWAILTASAFALTLFLIIRRSVNLGWAASTLISFLAFLFALGHMSQPSLDRINAVIPLYFFIPTTIIFLVATIAYHLLRRRLQYRNIMCGDSFDNEALGMKFKVFSHDPSKSNYFSSVAEQIESNVELSKSSLAELKNAVQAVSPDNTEQADKNQLSRCIVDVYNSELKFLDGLKTITNTILRYRLTYENQIRKAFNEYTSSSNISRQNHFGEILQRHTKVIQTVSRTELLLRRLDGLTKLLIEEMSDAYNKLRYNDLNDVIWSRLRQALWYEEAKIHLLQEIIVLVAKKKKIK